jgi:hypothetical protein
MYLFIASSNRPFKLFYFTQGEESRPPHRSPIQAFLLNFFSACFVHICNSNFRQERDKFSAFSLIGAIASKPGLIKRGPQGGDANSDLA